MVVYVGAMNGRVTAGAPAGPPLKKPVMTATANFNFITRSVYLGMTTQAKVGVTGNKQLVVDRTVRTVADGAAFPQRFVLKDEGSALIPMTFSAGGIMLSD